MPHFLSRVSGSAQLFLSESLADRARLWAGGVKRRLAAYIPRDFRNQLRTYDEIMYHFLGKDPLPDRMNFWKITQRVVGGEVEGANTSLRSAIKLVSFISDNCQTKGT